MSKASKQRFTDNYLIVQETYKEVNDIFSKFESGEIPEDEQEKTIEGAMEDIKKVQALLRKLNIKDIYGEYEEEFIKGIAANMEFFKESFEHIYERFNQSILYDEIIGSVTNYISDMKLFPSEYKKWARNEKNLAAKFTEALVKHAHIFKNQIHRIAIGTMNAKEFKKIYDANKNKMIPAYSFESYRNY